MQNPRRNVMKSVKVERAELLGIVRANKEKHITDFNEAVEDYKAAVLKLATANLKLAKTADLNNISQIKGLPTRPSSYADSYTRAIRMLELSVEDVIELGEDVFNQLVLDEWHWKNSFTASAALYKTF